MTTAERQEHKKLDRKWATGTANRREIMRAIDLGRTEDAEFKKTVAGDNKKEISKMTYKIEGHGEGGDWSEDYVGNDTEANAFDTESEAAAMVPGLAKTFECNVSDFRVVEREVTQPTKAQALEMEKWIIMVHSTADGKWRHEPALGYGVYRSYSIAMRKLAQLTQLGELELEGIGSGSVEIFIGDNPFTSRNNYVYPMGTKLFNKMLKANQ